MVKKIFQYGISGGTALVLDLAFLYVLFAYTSLHYTVAISLAFLFGTIVNYTLSRLIVFKETTRSISKGYIYFLQIALVGVLLTVGFVALMVEFLVMDKFASRIIAAALVFIWSFAANYFLNFKAHR